MKKKILRSLLTLALCFVGISSVEATVTLSDCATGGTGYTLNSSMPGSCAITLNSAWNAADDLNANILSAGTRLSVNTAAGGNVTIAGITYANGDVSLSAVSGTTLTINGAISAGGGNVLIENVPGKLVISCATSGGTLLTVSNSGKVMIKSSSLILTRKAATDHFAEQSGSGLPLILDERSVIEETSADANTLTITPLLMPVLTQQNAKAGQAVDYNLSGFYFDPKLSPVSLGGYLMNGGRLLQAPISQPGIYDVVVKFTPRVATQVFGPNGGAAISGWTFERVWRIDPDNTIGGIEFYPIFDNFSQPGTCAQGSCGFGRPCRCMPGTGFPAGKFTALPEQPENLRYQDLNLSLEIPTLSVHAELVSVPEDSESWAVEWLQDRAGLLTGSALPGEGHSFIAAHNHLNNDAAGPFQALGGLKQSDLIFVRQADGNLTKFSVYDNQLLKPDDVETISAIAAQEAGSMVLITCENQVSDGSYQNRRVIFAKPM